MHILVGSYMDLIRFWATDLFSSIGWRYGIESQLPDHQRVPMQARMLVATSTRVVAMSTTAMHTIPHLQSKDFLFSFQT